jgi:hypothetical protein
VAEIGAGTSEAELMISQLEDEGKTAMLMTVDSRLTATLAVADTLKEHSRDAVAAIMTIAMRPEHKDQDTQASPGLAQEPFDVLPDDTGKHGAPWPVAC